MYAMHCDSGYAWTFKDIDEGGYSLSYTYSFAPAPTIGQLSGTEWGAWGDDAIAEFGFTHVEYLDGSVTRHDDYSGIPEFPKVVVRNGMTRADWTIHVFEAWAGWLANFFFWGHVS